MRRRLIAIYAVLSVLLFLGAIVSLYWSAQRVRASAAATEIAGEQTVLIHRLIELLDRTAGHPATPATYRDRMRLSSLVNAATLNENRLDSTLDGAAIAGLDAQARRTLDAGLQRLFGRARPGRDTATAPVAAAPSARPDMDVRAVRDLIRRRASALSERTRAEVRRFTRIGYGAVTALALIVAAGAAVVVTPLARRTRRYRRTVEAVDRRMQSQQAFLDVSEEVAHVGYWQHDLPSGELYWSPQVYRIFGAARDFTPTLAAAADFYHPDDRERVADSYRAFLEGRRPSFHETYRIVRVDDGRVRHVVCAGMRQQDADAARAFGTIHDVTDAVESDAQLRDQARRIQLMADALPVLLVYFDTDLVIRFANRTAAAWFDRDPAAIVGHTIDDILGADTRARLDAHLRRAATGRPEAFETRIAYPDGVTRDVHIQYVPETDGETVRGFYALVTDVSERNRLRAQAVQAQKMEALGQLTGGIVHDFNNVLSIIRGNLQLLARRGEIRRDERLAKWVDTALASSDRGAELADRLLMFGRQKVLEPELIDAGDRLRGELAGILDRSLGSAIAVEIDAPETALPVRVDPAQFESALLNLAINARDSMPDGGTLTISAGARTLGEAETAAPGPYVVVAVTDTGTGMSEEVRQQAFEPFYTTKDAERGTGLGLSTIYGFLRESGGFAEIDTAEGQGTTVRLHFPRADAGADAGTGAV